MRTGLDFVQRVDDEIIWRRRELTTLKVLIENSRTNLPQQQVLLRAGIALLYAHWEGFIKKCGSLYLEYVSNQGLKAIKLQPNFIAIKLSAKLVEAAKSKKISTVHDLVDFFCLRLNDQLKIPYKGVVDTQSNLSSKVFKELMSTLGLNADSYGTKSQLIDSSLVDRRNHVAHGDALDISISEYLDLHDEVCNLIEEFRNQIQNSAATKAFLR